MITKDMAQPKFQRYVAIRTTDDDDELRGTVLEVGDDALVLQTRTDTRVVQYKNITDLIVRRKSVTIRRIRKIADDTSLRQHLADRHAILVSLLKVADEKSLRRMHNNMPHHDLGHQHVDPEAAMAALNPSTDDEGE